MGIREVLSVEAVKAALLALTTDGQAIGNSGGTLTGIDAGGGAQAYRTVSRIDPANGNWEGAFLGAETITRHGVSIGTGSSRTVAGAAVYDGAHNYANSTGTPGCTYQGTTLSPAARPRIVIDCVPAVVDGGYGFPEAMIKYGAHANASNTTIRNTPKPTEKGYWVLQEGSAAPLRAICCDGTAFDDVSFTATGGGTYSIGADEKVRIIIDDTDPAGPGGDVVFTVQDSECAVLATATCSTHAPSDVATGYLQLIGVTNDSGASVRNLWYYSSCIQVRT